MSVVPNVINKKRKKTESKPQSQLNKCLNEKRRREQENIYIEELAELISASASDMSSLSVKPDKCAILQETVNQIRRIRQNEPDQSDELQQSEVSSSKPTILPNDVYGPMLLEALDGFLFVVNIDGKIEFVSDNVTSYLKYTQDDLVETSIYKIIHVGDRARFSSSLLPMMSLGNVSGLTPEPNTGVSKSRSFNCRFLIKSDFSEENMDDKQSCGSPPYENMQVSAIFFPVTTENNENANNSTDAQNHLACVARRIPPNEKSPTSLGVEQFTTRLDLSGKIIAIDISGLSSPYSQHLHKDLVGCILQELCHPSDLTKLNQHLKETLRSGSNTSAMYRFRVGQDRYVHMQTKSRRFNYSQSSNEQEFIMSTHSIIRDSDNPSVLDSNSAVDHASPSCNPTTGALANNLNGSMGTSGTSLSTTFTSLPALSPGNQEFAFTEMFDMFPAATNWGLDNNSASRDSNGLSVGNFTANSPQSASASGHSASRSASVQQTNSAFSPGMISGKSSSSNPSPSAPGRAPTPFSSSLSFSPAPAPSVVAKTVSPGTSATKNDDFSGNSSEGQRLEISSGTHFGSAQANQKLRDLLTKNVEGMNRSTPLGTTSDECNNLNRNIRVSENSAQMTGTVTDELISRSPATRNLILRELLNQDEDYAEPIENAAVNSMGNKLSTHMSDPGVSKSDSDTQKKIGSNDMLRRLLNSSDDVDRNYQKSHELIHQFLKGSSPDMNEKTNQDMELHSSHLSEISVPKEMSIERSSSSPGVSMLAESTAQKRKPPEDAVSSNSVSKKPNVGSQHTHLAGQNPMLASMLAQTPRTPPSVPTSIANSIMSQLPQERLPKNLEKKLIHTPYTTVNTTPSTPPATRVFTSQSLNRNVLTTASIQQNIVTSDSRTQLSQLQSRTLPVGVSRTNYARAQQQQSFLSKALGSIENIQISQTVSSTAVAINVSQQPTQNANPMQQFSPVVPETLSSSQKGLRDMLCESDFVVEEASQQDTVLNDILEELWSLEEELRGTTTTRAVPESSALLKLREGICERPVPAAIIPPKQNENEKVAIRSIQLELMNFEGEKLSEEASHEVPQQSPLVSTELPSSLSSQQSQLPTSVSSVLSQFSSVPQPPSYTNSTVVGGRIRLPVTVSAGDVLTNSQQILELAAMQRIGLSQYGSLASTSTVVNATQIKRSLMERKQKLYLQQQQKRLLEQQQKQQLTMQTQQPIDIIGSSSSATYADMNELLNNTVAPNVSLLQRSSNVPEQQLSPRYSGNVIAQLPSPVGQPPPAPSQLSPNQRVNPQSPFSPISQQPFSSATPPTPSYQSQPSPHPVPSYVQGGSSHSPAPLPSGVTTGSRSPHLQLSPQQGSGPPQWNQRSSQNQLPNNLLQQNPMLNAQLSQGSFTPGQIRLAAQQQRQIPMRSLPSPGSAQSSRSSPFGGAQSDGNFSPLSPIAYQSQGPQQRLQRTVSGPGRVTSTRTTAQGGYVGNEPVLSPQPQPSPGFSQSVPSTPVSSYASVSGHTNPVFSLSQENSQFSFDPQNVQIFASTANERPRTANSIQVSSDFVRQELRAIVGARTQQHAQGVQVGTQHGGSTLSSVSLASGTITTAASVADALSMQSLSNSTLEDLGISVELIPSEVPQDVAELYSQSLLSIAGSSENSNSRGCIPSPRVEETKPGQKKSLLQQLLSEPT